MDGGTEGVKDEQQSLSLFTLLLFEQWEGAINTDEHSQLTQLGTAHIHHAHPRIEGLQQKIRRNSHDAFHQCRDARCLAAVIL